MTEMEAKRFHAFGNMPTLHDEGLAFLVSAGQRTDGLARKYTLQSFFKPENRNQAEVVTASSKPILAIQGESDAGINNDYIKGLLGDRCVILPGGHGLIYTQASVVGNIVKRFLSGV